MIISDTVFPTMGPMADPWPLKPVAGSRPLSRECIDNRMHIGCAVYAANPLNGHTFQSLIETHVL
ncbi:MAG: hypothetical protein K9L30_05550 [Desulfobacterales bacterium]|nr:hypothetical protein [Desulfobacterales bacterium]